MKRTFLSVGMTALVSFYIFGILDSKAVKVIFAVAFIAFIVFLLFKKLRFDGTLPIIAFTVACCCLVFTAYDASVRQRTNGLADSKHYVTGEIISLPVFDNGRVYYTLKTETIGGVKNSQKIRLSLKNNLNASPYDKIEGELNLYKLGVYSDEIENYYSSKGFFLGGYPDYNYQLKLKDRTGFHPMYYVLMCKKAITDSVLSNIPDESGALLTGLLIGDKTLIADETLESFTAIGSYHLLAVSGLHITVWAGFVYSLLNAFRLKKKLCYILSIFFILFFMALTGFNPPVVRAGILMIFVFLGALSGKEADNLNSIGFAVTLMLLINPYASFSKSLWLSVFASFGIILFSQGINRFLKRREFSNRVLEFISSFILQSFSVSISVSIITFPLTALFFDSISLVTLLSNLVLIEVSSVAMLLTGFASLFYIIGLGFLSGPAFFVSSLLSKFILGFSHALASLKYISVSTASLPVKAAAVMIPLAVIAFYYIKKKNRSGKNFNYSE